MKRVVHVFMFNDEDEFQTFEFMGRIDNKFGFVTKKTEHYRTQIVLLADEKVVDEWLEASGTRETKDHTFRTFLKRKFFPEDFAEEIDMLRKLTKLHKKSKTTMALETWILEESADFASKYRELAGFYLTQKEMNS